MARETLILTGRQIAESMPLGAYVEAVETAFRSYSEGGMRVPEVGHIQGDGGAFHIKSAAFAGRPPYAAVKINANFPGNPDKNGLPTIQGAVVLFDLSNGFPLAILDSIEITAMRTAAATAVAARHLADPESKSAMVVGCGVQARIQLEALMLTLPLRKVFAHDIDSRRCSAFVSEARAEFDVEIVPVEELAEASRQSPVIVTCTPSTHPILGPEHVRPGSFIAAIGADAQHKHEIAPELMRSARVVVDALEQCEQIGDLHHAIAAGVMTRSDVHADLGDVVRGIKPGRESKEDIIVFDSTGFAIQDVAAAGRIYEEARERGLGTKVELA